MINDKKESELNTVVITPTGVYRLINLQKPRKFHLMRAQSQETKNLSGYTGPTGRSTNSC